MFSIEGVSIESTDPELQLWANVLHIGILDASLYKAHLMGESIPPTKDRINGWYWVLNTVNHKPGSFIWCCNIFNLDHHEVRRLIKLRWRQIVKEQMKFKNKG